MTKSRAVLAVATAAVCVAAIACSHQENTRAAEWESRAMSCTTDTETFGDYPVGEAVAVKDPDATFSAAGCTLTGSGDVLDIDEKRSYYVINTGADRSDVELSAVDGTTLDVSHLRPGDGCATTADWRGNLILVVDTATPPASVPEVNYTVVQEQC